ncbi:MAG TPA: hypothetical protein VFU49_13100 [Ktedonobacteraceae bacterium]|nr:hypothetical protein [Ktedonobacteraceae bacterium]
MTTQHSTQVRNIVSQWFSNILLSTTVRYGMLSLVILAVLAGLSVVSMLALHVPALHALTSSLQLFNKVPFGEPWPQP